MVKVAFSPEKRRAAFWAKVDRRGADECWPWRGARDLEGYGRVELGAGRVGRAHRSAYQYAVGPLPTGLLALHRCDNPPCCNPAHLYAGTPADNMADRDARGRRRNPYVPALGEHHPHSKLTEASVRAIRARYAAGGVSYQRLATEYGVTNATIGCVVRRTWWAHVA